MALETVIFQDDPFVYCYGDLIHSFVGGGTGLSSHVFEGEKEDPHKEISKTMIWSSGLGLTSSTNDKEFATNSSSQETWACGGVGLGGQVVVGRRKRRRNTYVKNQEEVEHQRITHITVERNRRKQMNKYLAMLRSMMPPSYSQRGEQASVVGGAINFVKKLEQILQSLESHKNIKNKSDTSFPPIFSGFFTFPQYSTFSNQLKDKYSSNNCGKDSMADQNPSAIADVEVTMVESHANLKIFTRKYPRQLLKMVTALYSIGLDILHLNVATLEHSVLYSFSVKVQEESQLTSVNEIATAVYEMVGRLQAEVASNFSSD